MTNLIKQNVVRLVWNRFTNFILIAFIFAFLISYVYLANMAVRNVTALQNTKSEMEALSARVSDLEHTGFSIDEGVSPEVARSLGLVEVNQPVFIKKNSSKSPLSLLVR